MRTLGAQPDGRRAMPAFRDARIIIIAMLISGALAGMMALNPIMGDQHRLQLEFVSGAGFVGIAVALMGRSHPVGIVLAGDPVRHALSGRRRARLRDAGDHRAT